MSFKNSVNSFGYVYCRKCGEKLVVHHVIDHYNVKTGEPMYVYEQRCVPCEGK